jgi:hypothetical protein
MHCIFLSSVCVVILNIYRLFQNEVVSVHSVNAWGGEEAQFQKFLFSEIDGGQGRASRPRRFNPCETVALHIKLKAGGPRFSVDILERNKVSCPYLVSNYASSIILLVV